MYNYDREEIIGRSEESNLTYKEVWETLSKIDVSPYLDTKGQFSYLSWSYARAILSHFYPQYRVIWLPSEKFEDSTMMLHCRVEIDHLSREHWLPVYDNKYNAIANPNADDIQDNMQRCFVKTVALFGLGIQVFHNGSGTPEELELENPNETSKEQLAKALILIDKLEMKNEKPKSKK
jgi:hypothetical protein|tara:strand:+ start:482 stop:1015 length:534 start_codon:yes stop_codon:yes gene_type:complete